MKKTRFGRYTQQFAIIGITLIILFTIITTVATTSGKAQNPGNKEQIDITTWNGTKMISEEYTIEENETNSTIQSFKVSFKLKWSILRDL